MFHTVMDFSLWIVANIGLALIVIAFFFVIVGAAFAVGSLF